MKRYVIIEKASVERTEAPVFPTYKDAISYAAGYRIEGAKCFAICDWPEQGFECTEFAGLVADAIKAEEADTSADIKDGLGPSLGRFA